MPVICDTILWYISFTSRVVMAGPFFLSFAKSCPEYEVQVSVCELCHEDINLGKPPDFFYGVNGCGHYNAFPQFPQVHEEPLFEPLFFNQLHEHLVFS